MKLNLFIALETALPGTSVSIIPGTVTVSRIGLAIPDDGSHPGKIPEILVGKMYHGSVGYLRLIK
jgi:hypothetical protein